MNRDKKVSISVVFPMFNEKEYIRKTIKECESVLRDVTSSYEIIVVDDASTDGSGSLMDELVTENPHLKVAHHKLNRKLGGTLKTGFGLAAKDLVLYSDIDMPFDFKEIKKALSLMHQEKADLVSVYRLNRWLEGVRRYIYSLLYNWFIRLAFGLRIRDVNFSFKLIRKPLLDKISLCSEGSFIDAELLISAKRNGAKIVQFGTTYHPRIRGVSRLSGIGIIIKILQEAFSFRFRRSKGREPNP